MKIVYIHQYFNTPQMSGGTRSYEMARRMVAAGHVVHLITSYREQDSRHTGWFKTVEAGINVHWFPVPYSNSMNYRQRMNAFLSFALAAKKKASALSGDVIFATSTPLTVAIPAVLAARRNKIPMVFEVRDLWPEMPIAMGALNNPFLQFLAKKLERWAYKNAKAVVALSPGMKGGVARTGYPVNDIGVIPNSSDNMEFKFSHEAASLFRKNRKWLGDYPLLVYAGTFGKVNGVSYMVELAKELLALQSDIRILLIGQGSEREAVIEAAKSVGVLNVNLFVENPLPKNEIPALMSAATITSNLVIDLPEARANSANKFFDSLAAGKPILLNHGGWMNDIVSKYQCGLAMWRLPVAKVALELNTKVHDDAWLESAGNSARAIAEKYFDRETLAQELIRILENSVYGGNSSAETIAPGKYESKCE